MSASWPVLMEGGEYVKGFLLGMLAGFAVAALVIGFSELLGMALAL